MGQSCPVHYGNEQTNMVKPNLLPSLTEEDLIRIELAVIDALEDAVFEMFDYPDTAPEFTLFRFPTPTIH